jgi:hypothetical protein
MQPRKRGRRRARLPLGTRPGFYRRRPQAPPRPVTIGRRRSGRPAGRPLRRHPLVRQSTINQPIPRFGPEAPPHRRIGAVPDRRSQKHSATPARAPQAAPLVVANARRSPGYVCALRLNRHRLEHPLGRAGLLRRLWAASLAGAPSEVLLAESLDARPRAKFSVRLAQAGLALGGHRRGPAQVCSGVVSPSTAPTAVAADADDDRLLAAALTRRADPIASAGKRHLLPLGEHEGLPIVSARRAIAQLEARPDPGSSAV